MTVQDYCIKPWTHSAVTAHCQEAVIRCLHDSAGLPHRAMDPRRCHRAVMWLSMCCQEAVVLMTVQDYCIRPNCQAGQTIATDPRRTSRLGVQPKAGLPPSEGALDARPRSCSMHHRRPQTPRIERACLSKP
jgi:hypothetical protein